jgi:HSP20 family protein
MVERKESYMPETIPVRKTEGVFEELRAMQERIMNRAYDIFLGSGAAFGRDLDNWLAAERELVWKPAIELEETEREFKLKVAVPGIEPRDLDIEVTPDDFLVKAEVRHEHKKEAGKVHMCEFVSNNLFRAVHFPKKIDPEKVKAEFKNGLLYVTAEIAEEAKAKKVKIEAA